MHMSLHGVSEVPLLVLAWGSLWFMLCMNKQIHHQSLQCKFIGKVLEKYIWWKVFLIYYWTCRMVWISYGCVSHCWGHRCFSASALWACFFILLFIRTCSAWPTLLTVTKFYFRMFWWDWNPSSPHFMTCLEWNIIPDFYIIHQYL